jgi:hypothetical protein
MRDSQSRLRLIWALFFGALLIASVVFALRQATVVVVHGEVHDEAAIKAFDEGLWSGFSERPGTHVRSLRVTDGDSMDQFCAGVWYALKDIAPTLLIAVGERARVCLQKPELAPLVPRVIVAADELDAADQPHKQIVVGYQMPLQTWSEAFASQARSGKTYRVRFLAEDSALARAQQKAFASVNLPGIKISTHLVTSWPEWRAAAQGAAQDSDLLVVGEHDGLKDLPHELQQPAALVAMTRQVFGKDLAATELEAVAAGASWAIEPEPRSIGRRAADSGRVLLGQLPASAVSAPNISIAMALEQLASAQPLPKLFEAVARSQANIVDRRLKRQ